MYLDLKDYNLIQSIDVAAQIAKQDCFQRNERDKFLQILVQNPFGTKAGILSYNPPQVLILCCSDKCYNNVFEAHFCYECYNACYTNCIACKSAVLQVSCCKLTGCPFGENNEFVERFEKITGKKYKVSEYEQMRKDEKEWVEQYNNRNKGVIGN